MFHPIVILHVLCWVGLAISLTYIFSKKQDQQIPPGYTLGSKINPGDVSLEFRKKLLDLYLEHGLTEQDFENTFKKSVSKAYFQVEFKVEDFWIGVFWKTTYDEKSKTLNVSKDEIIDRPKALWEIERVDYWICIIPCFPLHIWKEYK